VEHIIQHFYQDFDDWVDRLESPIQQVDQIRQTGLQDAVARFDWSKMAPVYDDRPKLVGSANVTLLLR
jgi:hypothetical protein